MSPWCTTCSHEHWKQAASYIPFDWLVNSFLMVSCNPPNNWVIEIESPYHLYSPNQPLFSLLNDFGENHRMLTLVDLIHIQASALMNIHAVEWYPMTFRNGGNFQSLCLIFLNTEVKTPFSQNDPSAMTSAQCLFLFLPLLMKCCNTSACSPSFVAQARNCSIRSVGSDNGRSLKAWSLR